MEQLGSKIGYRLVFASLLLLSAPPSALAQLNACDQINVDPISVVNGCIGKTLADQIGSGHGDEFTPGSAVYLIKRDPARSIRRGRQLFQRKFSFAEGLGPRVNNESTGDINQTRALGAGLSDSCASCHGRPKGSAGFGGDVATRPDSRDAPHLFGLGLVEQLAEEMTDELRGLRAQASAEAETSGNVVSKPLVAKNISFGRITAFPDGTVDTSEVQGIDEDLRLRPFFHHGATASIREFIFGALNDEMGLQAWDPILCAVTDSDNPQALASPSGFYFDPATDDFDRPPVCSPSEDGDADGLSNEIDPALLDHLEFYLLNYFKPGQYQVTRGARNGRRLMNNIGCTSCHTADLNIDSDRRVADVETIYDPQRGIFNQLFATASTRFEPVDDGQPSPQLLPLEDSFMVRNFFSDLKRHDLGPAFHEREYDGTLVTEFVTEPLWGVGSTAPYGHDGRSINLDAVIRRHGGEAEAAKQAYLRLRGDGRRNIIEFLQTLVLFPPDDTASNLNPGDADDSFGVQDPNVHGTINLGALFQLSDEGSE